MSRWRDPSRYPTLSDAGERMLAFMREHPAAPSYRNTSGNKLLPDEVEALHRFEQQVADARPGWESGTLPEWLAAFAAKTYASVPHYRAMGSAPRRFQDIAPVSRAD